MKIIIRLFAVVLLSVYIAPVNAAVVIKKAAPVAKKETSVKEASGSLLPTVIGLVSGVMEMNQQQKSLSDECIPSTQERAFVDNTLKEWAKTGQVSADEIQKVLGYGPCSAHNGYDVNMKTASADGMKKCYNFFGTSANAGTIWENYPRTGNASYCKDGYPTCPGKEIRASDTYDLFNLIDFGQGDYLPNEITMASRLLNKVEICSSSRLSAKKKALWGDFLVNTAGNLGKTTNTGTIMEQVGGIAGTGGIGSLGSLSGIASQFIK